MNQPRPKLTLTTPRQVGISAVAGAIVCVVLLLVLDVFNAFPPVVPWTVPGVLVVMAVAAWSLARSMPRRREERSISSGEAVAVLLVAKSIVMTGAVLAGGHAVYVGRFVGALFAEQPTARVLQGSTTIIASLLLAVAGYALEKACMVSVDDGSDGGGNQVGNPA